MIPKKIHYCWLSGEEFPASIKKAMNTWKEFLPDYEFILWDDSRFDVNSVACVKDSYYSKRWAFAADYIRLYALYTEGGIYLDTDVIVRKNFDELLSYSFFSGIDWHFGLYNRAYPKIYKYRKPVSKIIPDTPWAGINAAILGAEKGNCLVKDLLDWYEDNQNEIKPSKLDIQETLFEYIAPEIFATIAQNYGFDRTKNITQKLQDNMVIFSSSIFGANITQLTEDSFAVHCTNGSWKPQNKWYHNSILRKMFGVNKLQKSKFDFFDEFKNFERFNFPE